MVDWQHISRCLAEGVKNNQKPLDNSLQFPVTLYIWLHFKGILWCDIGAPWQRFARKRFPCMHPSKTGLKMKVMSFWSLSVTIFGEIPPTLLVVFQVFKLFLFCEISSLNCLLLGSYNPWSKGWLPWNFLQAATAHWNSHAGLTGVATFGHHARALSKWSRSQTSTQVHLPLPKQPASLAAKSMVDTVLMVKSLVWFM